jgi:two-component system response regulator YesN
MLTILIVDDERIEQDYLSSIFRKYPNEYRVIGFANNGEQAVSYGLQKKPDIIIMDINLPMINGLEAAKMIRIHNPSQIIILNSGYAEFEFAQQAVQDQLDAFLLKPAPEDKILSTIQCCFARKLSKAGPKMETNAVLWEEFPFEELEELTNALLTKDYRRYKVFSEKILQFLQAQKTPISEKRFHLYNLLFQIESAIYRSSRSKDLITILDLQGTFRTISRAHRWQELTQVFGEFFNRLGLLLSMDDTQRDEISIVVEYIENNYAEDLRLASLASLVHLSPSYLSRLFKQRTGKSLSGYINEIRVENATERLRNTDMDLQDIAFACGFASMSSFYRVYKQICRITPTQMRKGL